MTGEAAAVLDRAEELLLAPHVGHDAVAFGAGAGELARDGDLQERVPVAGWIVLRRGCWGWGGDCAEVEGRAGSCLAFRGVDQAVTADPDVVAGVWEVGDEEAAAVVGDDDLGELGREVAGF